MKANISKAQIDMARKKAESALAAAYGPMAVSGKMMCWEGRIAQAQDKAQSIIDSGKMTKEQALKLISDFEQQYWTALTTARIAQDEYYNLCNQAKVTYQPLLRPYCPCDTCADRILLQIEEEYRRALQTLHESLAGDDAVSAVRAILMHCQQSGIHLKLPMEVY
jgi:hypothetical protein